MNRADYAALLDSLTEEMAKPEGIFQARFGKKTAQELEELREVAAIALMAADHYYSHMTELEFSIRERDEH